MHTHTHILYMKYKRMAYILYVHQEIPPTKWQKFKVLQWWTTYDFKFKYRYTMKCQCFLNHLNWLQHQKNTFSSVSIPCPLRNRLFSWWSENQEDLQHRVESGDHQRWQAEGGLGISRYPSTRLDSRIVKCDFWWLSCELMSSLGHFISIIIAKYKYIIRTWKLVLYSAYQSACAKCAFSLFC